MTDVECTITVIPSGDELWKFLFVKDYRGKINRLVLELIITEYSELSQPIKVRDKQYSLAWDIQISVMNKLDDSVRSVACVADGISVGVLYCQSIWSPSQLRRSLRMAPPPKRSSGTRIPPATQALRSANARRTWEGKELGSSPFFRVIFRECRRGMGC